MQIGMRQVPAGTLEWLAAACKGGNRSRTALARELCERGGWSGPAGRPCLSSARKLLPAPAGTPGTALPGAEAPAPAPHGRPPSDFPDNPVSCPLRELGPLSLELAVRPAARRRREAMIGWSADARMNDIGQVACNNRFLLLPSVRVHGLASRVLRPEVLPAADIGAPSGVRRAVWLRPLVEGWRDALCREKQRCAAERLVPAMQDTTTPNHDGLATATGLDGLGGGGKGSKGILAHVGVAVNAAGRPLGITWPMPASAGKRRRTAPAGWAGSTGHGSRQSPAPGPGW